MGSFLCVCTCVGCRYVTLEVMTYVHLFFVNEDRTMYHEESDTPAKARSNIVTDLGQVGRRNDDVVVSYVCDVRTTYVMHT